MYPWTDTSPSKSKQKWQRVWEDARAFYTPNPPAGEEPENHWYQLEMLPYPSGTLHMGHVLNYTMGDVLTHFRRRQGWMVMRPMGWDSFGLPAENAAIREGGHPKEIVERNIKEIRDQMRRIGWVIDWDREISAHHPGFYRWTQWLFLRFFERGLAYRKAAPVNWCPIDQTVVANEYVIDGHCERCGTLVEARNLEQWFMKITAYADELLRFEGADWPERTMTIQRNWIGRSEGAEIIFRVEELDRDIEVFTTRPDTLYGATFFVVAPEHPFVEEFGTDEVKEYARRTAAQARRGARDRGGEDRRLHRPLRDKPGERGEAPDLGRRLRADGLRHRRDHGRACARRARPPVRRDLRPAGRQVIDEDGRLVNSQEFDGLPFEEAKKAIVEKLRGEGKGATAVSYRLRDWSMSRQRYWGCPIPIVHCPTCGPVAVPDDELPGASCPRSRTTARRACPRSPATRSGCTPSAPSAAARPSARPTRWTPSSTRPGTSCATSTRATTSLRSTAASSTTGRRSRTTSAGSTTRPATCSTRASSSR